MKRMFVLIAVLLTGASAAWAQTTIPIDPRATYLRTSEDPQATNAVPISLAQLGIQAGDTITVRILGDLSYCYEYGCPEDPVWLAGGLFSSSSVLLPLSNLSRVPGAQPIRQGAWPPCESWNTYMGDLPTDIPQDFGFSSFESATVKVPPGAQWLFVAVVDSLYGDNADPNGDLAVEIQKALVAIPLNALVRAVPWEPDRMTSAAVEEWSQFPSEGQIFYVAEDPQEPATTALYRYYNGPDHRDSTLTELPDYWNEGAWGFAWTSKSLPGLSPMVEGFNSQTGDYALMQPGEQLPGYITEPLGIFGYKRFYNTNESLLSLTKGGVTVESNRVYGGILWRWKWNGIQFLSPYYWNGIQTFVFFDAGQGWRTMFEGAGSGTGSPIAVAKNEDTTQITRAVPLESSPTFDGHPSLWRDALVGKDLTLNFNGMGSVAKYTTVVSLPAPMPPAWVYQPILLLRALFTRFYTYRADTDELVEVSEYVPSSCESYNPFQFSGDFGGVIVSDASGQSAFGVYGVNESAGGPLTTLALQTNYCWHDGTDETSLDNVRIDALHLGPLPAGESKFNVYLMTDSLANVRQKMRNLFLSGVK